MKIVFNSMMKENRIALNDISWHEYESLLNIFTDKPLLGLTYLETNLEIMTNAPEQEMLKTVIGRLIEIYALEKAINLYGCGATTYKREGASHFCRNTALFA